METQHFPATPTAAKNRAQFLRLASEPDQLSDEVIAAMLEGYERAQGSSASAPAVRQLLRARPVEMRSALEIVDVLRRAGVLFVPMPVRTADEHARLLEGVVQQLDEMANESEAGEV